MLLNANYFLVYVTGLRRRALAARVRDDRELAGLERDGLRRR